MSFFKKKIKIKIETFNFLKKEMIRKREIGYLLVLCCDFVIGLEANLHEFRPLFQNDSRLSLLIAKGFWPTLPKYSVDSLFVLEFFVFIPIYFCVEIFIF
jgi:hypothetical protein